MKQLTKICWHSTAPPSNSDDVGLNLALAVLANCSSCKTACWRPVGMLLTGMRVPEHW